MKFLSSILIATILGYALGRYAERRRAEKCLRGQR